MTSEAYEVVDLWKSALHLATSKLSHLVDVVAVNAVSWFKMVGSGRKCHGKMAVGR